MPFRAKVGVTGCSERNVSYDTTSIYAKSMKMQRKSTCREEPLYHARLSKLASNSQTRETREGRESTRLRIVFCLVCLKNYFK